MIRLILVIFVLMSVSAPGIVNSRALWPEGAKLAYVKRCADSLASQGSPLNTAKSYCSCIADGMSNEFGMEEYDQMMQPNPNGSAYDRRLYKVFSACSSILPK